MAVYTISSEEPIRCSCAADAAIIEVPGAGTFLANFAGYMEVMPGEELLVDGLASVPLSITGHETVGTGAGIGEIRVSHDFDRALPLSELRQISPDAAFPAEQLMHVNILVRLGALPGVTLRNIKIGTLRNSTQEAFPPQDAIYELDEPIELEDLSNPGPVLARIVSYQAHINPR